MNPAFQALLTVSSLGPTLPVTAVVTVSAGAALMLAVGVGCAVWAWMMWARLRARYLRTAERNEILNIQRDELAAAAGQATADREEIGEILRLQKIKTEEGRRRSRNLEKILAVSARINATRDVPELVDQAVSAVAEITGFRKVVLYLWSDGTKAFEARAFSGLSDHNQARLTGIQVSREEYEELTNVRHRYSNCYLVQAEPTGFPPDPNSGEDSLVRGHAPGLVREWSPDLLLVAPLVSAAGETVGYFSMDEPADGGIPGVIEVRQLEFLLQQTTTALHSAEVYQRLARNNAELSLASEKLNSLAEMKRNFVANVSHELRTPLTSISAYSELLQNNMGQLSGDALQEFLKVIHAESLKLTGVINDILELNNIENGRPNHNLVDTDMVQMVRRLEESWKNRALERDIRLEVLATDGPIRMSVDSMLMQQLLAHLLGNAFKFVPDGGTVRVRLKETGTAVRLTVEDTGIGIPEDKLGQIFDKFYQVDSSATRKHNGQGVGLAICHDIVTHHDGRIWAENIEPSGTRFTVLLPRRPAVLQAANPGPAAGNPFEPGEFMQRLMHWISESLGIQMATLMAPGSDGDYLTIRAAIGIPEAVVQSTRVRRGSGFVGKVWATGETLLVDDITLDDRFARDMNEPRYSTPSLLCVPIRNGQEFSGVISVNNKVDGKPLDDDDRLFLEALAPHLGSLLDRFSAWQDGAVNFDNVRHALRQTTAVGHLRHESLLEVCHEICLEAARKIRLPDHELVHLAFALQFYDVGLSCVPPQLLNKPGTLTGHEARYIQKHVEEGLTILEPLKPDPKVRQIILHHHENYDGSGYPEGLAGEAIPLGARLVRLTDSLAALLSPRPWRPARSLSDALDEIREGIGRQFCPRMAEVFMDAVEARTERITVLQQQGEDSRELHRPALDPQGMVSLR